MSGAGVSGNPATGHGRRIGLLIAVASILAVVAGIVAGVGARRLLSASAPPPSPSPGRGGLSGEATWAAGTRPAPPISALRDQAGDRFALASLHGRTVAIVFFDSHCHQACPLAGRALAAAEQPLSRAQRPVLVVVSINPLDTPASTRAATRAWGLARLAPWHWLRGTHAELARVWRAYHIFVQPTKGDISHTEALYLVDRRGDERSGYLFPYSPRFVTHDLRKLAGEATGHA